jgi:hypothetical protein
MWRGDPERTLTYRGFWIASRRASLAVAMTEVEFIEIPLRQTVIASPKGAAIQNLLSLPVILDCFGCASQ